MTETSTQDDRRDVGAVERLARDDVERKRFLKMAGKGVGGAAIATGESITPNGAFDKPLTKKQVLTKADPLIKG